MNITPMKNGSVSAMIDDAVDEVIEIVLAKGGRVVFVEDGALNDHKHIALILRY
jgi:predicted transcriptional regulator